MVWTFTEWENKILENFEKHFYIGEDCKEAMVHKRAIYKDTLNSYAVFTDYQLRPNFPIAMCVVRDTYLKSLLVGI